MYEKVINVAMRYDVPLEIAVEEDGGKYWLMFTPVNFFKHDLDSLKLSEEMEGLGLWWSTSSKAWYYPALYVETPCADPRTELDNLAAEIFAEIKEE